MSLKDILPLNPKQYDKHRAPKFLGQPTIVYFHVTVLSLDSINEESMVSETDISNVGKFVLPFVTLFQKYRIYFCYPYIKLSRIKKRDGGDNMSVIIYTFVLRKKKIT